MYSFSHCKEFTFIFASFAEFLIVKFMFVVTDNSRIPRLLSVIAKLAQLWVMCPLIERTESIFISVYKWTVNHIAVLTEQ